MRWFPGSLAMISAAVSLAAPGQALAASRWGFEENCGQWRDSIRYVLRGRTATYLVEGDGVAIRARGESEPLAVRFVGGSTRRAPTGLEPLPGVTNHYHGSDPSRWAIGVPRFGSVLFPAVYPGVDAVLEPTAEGAVDLVFHAGDNADWSRVELEVQGGIPSIGEDGDIVVETPSGTLRVHAPLVVGSPPADPAPVYVKAGPGRFRIGGVGEVPSRRAGIDNGDACVTVVDPLITYSTYLGGTLDDGANDVAADSLGRVTVVGDTDSPDAPLRDPIQAALTGPGDVYIARFDSDGVLQFATYLGGSSGDSASDVDVSDDGSSAIGGNTSSPDWPVRNAFLPLDCPDLADGFVTKLDATGSLIFSSYVCGNLEEHVTGVALDLPGSVYVVGDTDSVGSFPDTAAFSVPGSRGDFYLVKLDATGALVYSGLLGGSGNEGGGGVAVTEGGEPVIVAETASPDFPLVNPIQATYAGLGDLFVARIRADGGSLLFSTLLGGTQQETAFEVAVDAAGVAYLAANTSSDDYPLANPIQSTRAGLGDIAVSVVDTVGAALVFSTYFGGNSGESARTIARDDCGRLIVAGDTRSTNLPTVNALQDALAGDSDAFYAVIDPVAPSIIVSSYFGGSDRDRGHLGYSSAAIAYLAGQTRSQDLPVVSPFQATLAGEADLYVTRLDLVPSDLSNTLRAVNSDPNVAMSWVGTTDATSYNLYRGTAKGVWPGPIASGLVSTTATVPDVAPPPSLYFYRISGSACGVEGP